MTTVRLDPVVGRVEAHVNVGEVLVAVVQFLVQHDGTVNYDLPPSIIATSTLKEIPQHVLWEMLADKTPVLAVLGVNIDWSSPDQIQVFNSGESLMAHHIPVKEDGELVIPVEDSDSITGKLVQLGKRSLVPVFELMRELGVVKLICA